MEKKTLDLVIRRSLVSFKVTTFTSRRDISQISGE